MTGLAQDIMAHQALFRSGITCLFLLLGVLIAIAGLGYIYDSIGVFASHGSWTEVSTVTFIGEFLLALWLAIRGRRITVSQPALCAEPTVAER